MSEVNQSDLDRKAAEPIAAELDPAGILDRVDLSHDQIPIEEIQAIRKDRDVFIPLIIERFREIARRARDGEDVEGCLPDLGLHVLCELKAYEAFPAVVELMSLPDETVANLFGDGITEFFPRAIAILGKNDIKSISSLVNNSKASLYVRSSAARSLLYLVADDVLSREAAVEILRKAVRNASTERGPDTSSMIGFLIVELVEYGDPSVRDEIADAYAKELVDRDIIDWKDCEESLGDGMKTFEKALQRLEPTEVFDVIEELEWWEHQASYGSFGEDDDFDLNDAIYEEYDDDLDESAHEHTSHSTDTIVNDYPKVGRNEPCPCGSGKKFKKCCGGH